MILNGGKQIHQCISIYFVDSKLLKEGQLLLVRPEVVLDQGLHLPLALVRLQQHFAAAP